MTILVVAAVAIGFVAGVFAGIWMAMESAAVRVIEFPDGSITVVRDLEYED